MIGSTVVPRDSVLILDRGVAAELARGAQLRIDHLRADGFPAPPALQQAAVELWAMARGDAAPLPVGSDPTSGVRASSRDVVRVSSRDAASRLGCAVRWITELCRSGQLAAERDDRGRWWIDEEDLTAMIEARAA